MTRLFIFIAVFGLMLAPVMLKLRASSHFTEKRKEIEGQK